ncbi:MAG: aminodeoxychorismate synthase component I [Phyllobacterium sp.]
MHIRKIPWLEPYEAAARLRSLSGLSFLDSAMRHPELGRYSYVAAEPFGTFVIRNREAAWNGGVIDAPPVEALRQIMALYPAATIPGLPPFQGGAIGFFSYEFGRLFENLPQASTPPHGEIPQASLNFYDAVLAFDHQQHKAWLISSGFPETGPAKRKARAEHRGMQVLEQLAQANNEPTATATIARSDWRSNFSRESYAAAVRTVIERILEGDIFQVNIAQRFVAKLPTGFDAWGFYGGLRRQNPATFAAYLEHDALVVASSSPERFLRTDGVAVETRPIKGTIVRARDPKEDAVRAKILSNSEKDRAENVMIVDLMRNDLSRVCKPFSVNVSVLCGVESYANVHHLVSVVHGVLSESKTALDLLQAAFPGGSITGAPKVRAMEIITEIEREARGVYCGSIGFLGFDGAFDGNIAIRTVQFQNGTAVLHAGGGITVLSDPYAEYEETLDKADRIFSAFQARSDAVTA